MGDVVVFLGSDYFGLFSILGRGTARSSLSQAPSRERLLTGSCESDSERPFGRKVKSPQILTFGNT